ncbi:hypothetical protein TeGR_g7620, partial [Tetraparma gracilis]
MPFAASALNALNRLVSQQTSIDPATGVKTVEVPPLPLPVELGLSIIDLLLIVNTLVQVFTITSTGIAVGGMFLTFSALSVVAWVTSLRDVLPFFTLSEAESRFVEMSETWNFQMSMAGIPTIIATDTLVAGVILPALTCNGVGKAKSDFTEFCIEHDSLLSDNADNVLGFIMDLSLLVLVITTQMTRQKQLQAIGERGEESVDAKNSFLAPYMIAVNVIVAPLVPLSLLGLNRIPAGLCVWALHDRTMAAEGAYKNPEGKAKAMQPEAGGTRLPAVTAPRMIGTAIFGAFLVGGGVLVSMGRERQEIVAGAGSPTETFENVGYSCEIVAVHHEAEQREIGVNCGGQNGCEDYTFVCYD